MAELTKRVELLILVDDDGLHVVTERREDGLLEVTTTSTLDEARAWVETHYEAVEWQAPRRGSGLVGRLTSGVDDVSSKGEYANSSHLQFVQDMEEAGLDVQHYQGRFYWEGPAVAVDDLQDALGATEVRCQWDHLGLGWIVYPRAYGHVRRIKEHEDAGPDEL